VLETSEVESHDSVHDDKLQDNPVQPPQSATVAEKAKEPSEPQTAKPKPTRPPGLDSVPVSTNQRLLGAVF
jgi:hypothetical protein